MKRSVLTFITPVLAFMSGNALAGPEKCAVEKQVYEFRPSGQKVTVGALTGEAGRIHATEFCKIPMPPAPTRLYDLPSVQKHQVTGMHGAKFVKIANIDASELHKGVDPDATVALYEGRMTCRD